MSLLLLFAASGCADSGFTPLFDAVSRGDQRAVEELLAQGQDPNEPSPPFDMTPLMGAAGLDDSISQLLIDAGADVNARDPDGWTPLAYAAHRRSPEAVRMLLRSGADPALVPASGELAGEPLCIIAGGESTETGKLLC